MNDLTELLHDSVDDHPITVPDLLPRARRARRRRTAGAAALVGALLIGSLIGVSQVLPEREPVALPAAPPSPDESGPTVDPEAPVPHELIVERCLPQLASYKAVPKRFGDHPDEGYTVAHPDREYRVGEPVLLHDGHLNMFTCLLPADGEVVADAVAALSPTLARPELVIGLCSETQWQVHGVYQGPVEDRRLEFNGDDLRGAEIVTAAEQDGLVSAMLRKDGRYYGCELASEAYDFAPRQVWRYPTSSLADVTLGGWEPITTVTASGAAAKSVVDDDVAYYYCAHAAPPGVRSVEIAGQVNGTVEVGSEGLMSCLLKGDAPHGITGATWVARDGDGRVVAEGRVD